MSQKKNESKTELNIRYHLKTEIEIIIEEPVSGKNREDLTDNPGEDSESAKTHKFDTSIGVLLGKNYQEFHIKMIRSINYIDCDNVSCSTWGQYTTCSTRDYKHCRDYAPTKGTPYFGITLKTDISAAKKLPGSRKKHFKKLI